MEPARMVEVVNSFESRLLRLEMEVTIYLIGEINLKYIMSYYISTIDYGLRKLFTLF